MQTSIAWKNGQWLPFNEVNLSLSDWGVIQGVVIVDRLRTCNSNPLDSELHFARLRSNCEFIGIPLSKLEGLDAVRSACALHNRSRTADPDFSIVTLVTPGSTMNRNEPTAIVHIQPLQWTSLAHWYQRGQQLFIADTCNVPAACWPPQLKTRARLHYYLADQEAAMRGGPHAASVLLDVSGNLTDTSAANLIVVDGHGTLCCSPESDVLGGISLIRSLRLAEVAKFKVVRKPIAPSMLDSAREVLLTGSSGCIWPASQCGERMFDKPTEQPVYNELLQSWIEDVGLDFCSQAMDRIR